MTPIRARLKKLGKTLIATIALILTSCSGYDGDRSPDPADHAGQGPVSMLLSVDAFKGSTTTRGLNPPDENNNIAAIWKKGDLVTVYSATGAELGTMVPTTTGSATTTLVATLNGSVKKGDKLNLVFPRTERDYTGQKGTLADIETKYDYANAQVTVQYVDGSFVSATDAHFTNQQAIVWFHLTDDNSSPINVSSLIISAEGLLQNATTTGPITITPTDATNEIYAALSGLNGIVTLKATDGNTSWAYVTPETKVLENGKFYRVTCKMKANPVAYSEPLTLECYDESGCSVTVSNYGDLEYSKNDGQWKAYTRQVNLQKGDKVGFRGTNATRTSSSQYMSIKCNGNCYIYGNVMSLLSKDSYATMTELPYTYTFQNLFKDNQYITHTEGKDLVLPATVLKQNCYFQMFYGCKNFNYVKCLATNISAKDCTYSWLYNTTKKGTFVKAKGFNDWTTEESGIPQGWTVKEE